MLLAAILNPAVMAEGDSGGDGGEMDGDYDGNNPDSDLHHHGNHHHYHGIGIGGYYDPWLGGGFYGPGWWGGYYGPGWGFYGYRGYGYIDPFYRPYYMAPPVIRTPVKPPIYIERQQLQPAQPRTNYWYYCQNPPGYYPTVKKCPDGWLQVAPRS